MSVVLSTDCVVLQGIGYGCAKRGKSTDTITASTTDSMNGLQSGTESHKSKRSMYKWGEGEEVVQIIGPRIIEQSSNLSSFANRDLPRDQQAPTQKEPDGLS